MSITQPMVAVLRAPGKEGDGTPRTGRAVWRNSAMSPIIHSNSASDGSSRTHDHLGEVVFVELPEPGTSVSQGKGFGAVESVKATSDINSPISGEVIEVNSKLTEAPGQINTSPYQDGWMIKVKPNNPSQLETLMGAKEYTKFCEEEDAAH
ncbi:hypothetical protein Leryth_005458 [Lithospermum erythrorhizon]|nr:hypothetical protein Leryth_005458 [Lithospermum erythrorhizon]